MEYRRASRFDVPDAVADGYGPRRSMPPVSIALRKTLGPGFGSSISSAVVRASMASSAPSIVRSTLSSSETAEVAITTERPLLWHSLNRSAAPGKVASLPD